MNFICKDCGYLMSEAEAVQHRDRGHTVQAAS